MVLQTMKDSLRMQGFHIRCSWDQDLEMGDIRQVGTQWIEDDPLPSAAVSSDMGVRIAD